MLTAPDGTLGTDLLELLERFNRKERFILFEQAVAGVGNVKLAPSYRSALHEALDIDVPASALVLTDFHLNWLYAALELHSGRWEGQNRPPGKAQPGQRQALERNQEDIDLLLAWKVQQGYHLVLVEAKAHSNWSSAQMTSKANRLRLILGGAGNEYYEGVHPHFVLTSFASPQKLTDVEQWPAWMRQDGVVAHVPLEVNTPRLLLNEVDKQGRPKRDGGLFAVRQTGGKANL